MFAAVFLFSENTPVDVVDPAFVCRNYIATFPNPPISSGSQGPARTKRPGQGKIGECRFRLKFPPSLRRSESRPPKRPAIPRRKRFSARWALKLAFLLRGVSMPVRQRCPSRIVRPAARKPRWHPPFFRPSANRRSSFLPMSARSEYSPLRMILMKIRKSLPTAARRPHRKFPG